MSIYSELRKQYLAEWRIWYKMHYNCKYNLDYYVETRVCDEWTGEQGFINWLDELGPRPGNNYVLDRINKLGDYEPGNVEWTTRSKSQLRQRRHLDEKSIINYRKRAETNGIHRHCFYARIRAGWNVEDASNLPMSQKKYYKRTA